MTRYSRAEFYKEWAKPQGLHDVVGVKVLHTEQRQGFFTADRFVSQPRYGEREVRLLTLLSPHVCRAVAISDVLSLKTIRSEALESALDALGSAVYLTDRYGRVVFMNGVAERQVKASNALHIENDRLSSVTLLREPHSARLSPRPSTRPKCRPAVLRLLFLSGTCRSCCYHPSPDTRGTEEYVSCFCSDGSDVCAGSVCGAPFSG